MTASSSGRDDGPGPTAPPAARVTARLLRACVEEVTVEEFRIGDFRVERDAALGRQLLFLLTNEEWLRRTSEHLEIQRVRVVDTEVLVDVDLSLVTPAALEGRRQVWLPILAVPPPQEGLVSDPVTSLEVTDAAGARVFKLPQSEVQRRFAAAYAEIVLARLPADRTDPDARAPRDELVLLAAAVRRLLAAGLAGNAPLGDTFATSPDGPDALLPRIDTGRARAEERLAEARSTLLAAFDADAARRQPLVASRLLEMLDALVGAVHVVVPADPAAGPTSFSVRLPGRRLRQVRRRWRLAPRARLRIALLAASGHSDRIVRLTLPEGIAAVGSTLPDDDAPPARIEVLAPRPVVELHALVEQVLDPATDAGSWVQRRLASLAVDKVEAVLELLGHYLVPAEGDDEPATRELAHRLRDLRTGLLDVVTPAESDLAGPTASLREAWAGGSWLPDRLRRRLAVNTATPGVVHLRATMVEGSAQRARTVDARLDLEIAVADSTVLDTARDINLINAALLVLVTGVLLLSGTRNVDLQTLATVLTLFPAVQAARIGRPDRSTVRGLLAQPTYVLSLATVLPPLFLAAAVAIVRPAPGLQALAVACTAAQLGLQVLLRRRPSEPDQAPVADRHRRVALLLTTDTAPDLSRLDTLRGTWCRELVADALLLGRQASAWVTAVPDEPGVFGQVLEDVPRGTLHGLLHATCDGRAITFTVVGAAPSTVTATAGAAGHHTGHAVRPGSIRAVRLDPGRLAAVDPPAWVIEILLATPTGSLGRTDPEQHPLLAICRAAAAEGFPVLFVQMPTPAPTRGPGDHEWLRVRVGVPFVPPGALEGSAGLPGLRRFLVAVDALRTSAGMRRPLHVYAVPELATYEASQTAPDEAGGRTVTGRDLSLVTAAGVDAGVRFGRPLVVCATARAGLLADILGAIASTGARLVGGTVAVLHGTTVVVLTVAEAGLPSSPLGEHVRQALAATDDVQVPLDTDDPTVLPRSPRRPAEGCLVRLNVRVPYRPQRLRSVLVSLDEAVRGRGASGDGRDGGDGRPLHVWSALFRVVEGRSLQGRLVARLATVPPWTTADLDGRSEPAAELAGATALEDDPVVTVEVLRTVMSVAPLEVDSARIPAPAAPSATPPATAAPAGVTLRRTGIDRP